MDPSGTQGLIGEDLGTGLELRAEMEGNGRPGELRMLARQGGPCRKVPSMRHSSQV